LYRILCEIVRPLILIFVLATKSLAFLSTYKFNILYNVITIVAATSIPSHVPQLERFVFPLFAIIALNILTMMVQVYGHLTIFRI
jgi:uncharacterized membrane protein YvlD (DUF360 family)